MPLQFQLDSDRLIFNPIHDNIFFSRTSFSLHIGKRTAVMFLSKLFLPTIVDETMHVFNDPKAFSFTFTD